MDAFISYSFENGHYAKRLSKDLTEKGLRVWMDTSELQPGVLLGKELQAAIRKCRVLILLWSELAAKSRWVNTEWLSAFHQNRFIIPCIVDSTPLPQFLQNAAYLDLRRSWEEVLDRLARGIRHAPDGANPAPPIMRSASVELDQAIRAIAEAQAAVTDFLARSQLDEAMKAQTMLDGVMEKALRIWALDPMIVNLAGYHVKNAYMLKHWDAVQAGRPPQDPLLAQAEGHFFESLWIDPIDPSALNGLGSILIFRRDFDAAEFFIRHAIKEARRKQIDYPAAEHDLAMLLHFKRQRKKPRSV